MEGGSGGGVGFYSGGQGSTGKDIAIVPLDMDHKSKGKLKK